jgi:hypothetical protein
MLDDFDDGLSLAEQETVMRLFLVEFEDNDIADYESDLELWEHSQGIGF